MATLTETKKKGTGNEEDTNYIWFFSGVPKEKRSKAGVAIVVSKKYKRCIKSWEEINERLMTLEMQIFGHTITIIAVYAPTNDANNDIKDAFENDLTSLLTKIGRRKEIIMLGDLNARTGHEERDPVVGSFGEDVVNENGNRMIEVCNRFDLRIMNGYFQHQDKHKYTWTQPTRGLKSIIDYLVIKQETNLKTHDVKALRGAECGTDHMLLRAKIYLKRRLNPQQSKEIEIDAEVKLRNKRYNLKLLQDESIAFLYKLRLSNKLAQEVPGRVEESYNQIKLAMHEAAYESLGEIENKEKTTYWENTTVEKKIKEKREAYTKWLASQDQEDRKEYVRLRREVKRDVIRAKNEEWNKKCEEVEKCIGGTKTREAWKVINTLRENNRQKAKIQMIQIETWKKYYEQMLTEDRQEYIRRDPEQRRDDDLRVERITEQEIREALKGIKNNKAPGPGNIPIELVKHAPTRLIEILQEIFNRCLIEREEIPTEWKLGYISSIYKKGSRTECKNYRGITVTSSVGRLYGRILKQRIEKIIEIGEEQCGFVAGRSCTDNIFTLSQVIQKRVARDRETHIVFVDLEKAYDTVPITKLLAVINNTNIPQVYIDAIRTMYNDQISVIKVGSQISQPFRVTKGLRQGCCLSPTLFKVYVNQTLKEWQVKCSRMGINIDGNYLHTLLFADDQVVLATDEDDINYMTRKLHDTYKKWGLKINFDKTKYMVVNGRAQDMQINGNVIKACRKYKYLGTVMSEEGNSREEIAQRIIQAKQATQKLNSILWSEQIHKETKKRLYNTLVKNILTYGAETWAITKRYQDKILATEMDFLRRSCRKSRLEHIRNEAIRESMEMGKTVIEEIEEKRLKWYGHMRRMAPNRWPQIAWSWIPWERRKRGRPPRGWNQEVQEAMESRDLQENDWQDKDYWRLRCERRL